MTSRAAFIVPGLTAVLWVVPSIGTQGMGTIGARVVHADAGLIDIVPERRVEARRSLLAADAAAETAIELPSTE